MLIILFNIIFIISLKHDIKSFHLHTLCIYFASNIKKTTNSKYERKKNATDGNDHEYFFLFLKGRFISKTINVIEIVVC